MSLHLGPFQKPGLDGCSISCSQPRCFHLLWSLPGGGGRHLPHPHPCVRWAPFCLRSAGLRRAPHLPRNSGAPFATAAMLRGQVNFYWTEERLPGAAATAPMAGAADARSSALCCLTATRFPQIVPTYGRWAGGGV